MTWTSGDDDDDDSDDYDGYFDDGYFDDGDSDDDDSGDDDNDDDDYYDVDDDDDRHFRIHLRNEFMRDGLIDVLEALENDRGEDLQTQLKIFQEHKEEDFDEFAQRYK